MPHVRCLIWYQIRSIVAMSSAAASASISAAAASTSVAPAAAPSPVAVSPFLASQPLAWAHSRPSSMAPPAPPSAPETPALPASSAVPAAALMMYGPSSASHGASVPPPYGAPPTPLLPHVRCLICKIHTSAVHGDTPQERSNIDAKRHPIRITRAWVSSA